MDAGTTQAADLLVAGSGKAGLVTPHTDLFSAFSRGPDKKSVMGDFTLEAYTGYVQIVTTLSAVYVAQPDDYPAWAASQAVFVGRTAGAAAPPALGWIMHDGAGVLYSWGIFDTPVSVTNATDRVSVDAEYIPNLDTVNSVSNN